MTKKSKHTSAMLKKLQAQLRRERQSLDVINKKIQNTEDRISIEKGNIKKRIQDKLIKKNISKNYPPYISVRVRKMYTDKFETATSYVIGKMLMKDDLVKLLDKKENGLKIVQLPNKEVLVVTVKNGVITSIK